VTFYGNLTPKVDSESGHVPDNYLWQSDQGSTEGERQTACLRRLQSWPLWTLRMNTGGGTVWKIKGMDQVWLGHSLTSHFAH
jgi:hypothetical protein